MDEPNKRQVGGTHYKTRDGYEHWDLCIDYNLGYFEGQITKYLTRWQKKNGPEDVGKALHYFDKLISAFASGRKLPPAPRPKFDVFHFQKFLRNNKLGEREHAVFVALLRYESPSQLATVRPVMEDILKEAVKRKADSIDSQRCPHGLANEGNCNECRGSLPSRT